MNILAFGIAREIAGESTVNVPLNDCITVEELRIVLIERYPELRNLKTFMIAVNGEYAKPGQVICKQDEVAIIPPVSGG